MSYRKNAKGSDPLLNTDGKGGGAKVGLSKYQQQLKGKVGQSAVRVQGQLERRGPVKSSSEKAKMRTDGDEIDAKFGFNRFTEGSPRLGWLLNYLPISMPDETGTEKSALDLYFLDRDGGNFKASIFHDPYLYVDVSDSRRMNEVANQLQKRFEGCRVESVDREDLDMQNHLSGKKHRFLKLSFANVSELMDAKSVLSPLVQANQKKTKANDNYEDEEEEQQQRPGDARALAGTSDPLSFICDMREYDVPYSMRVSIDLDIRVGAWYVVKPVPGSEVCEAIWQQEMLELCEPKILAFDIECEKAPLKFPQADKDKIYMISYMVAGEGYLIINREIVTKDIEDFEYTPKAQYPGPFHVFNEKTEEDSLRRFVSHIQEVRPHVIVTYNGDFFDWPFVDTRCQLYGISLYKQLGIKSAKGQMIKGIVSDGEYVGRCIVHLDAFCWVKRDSYLPQGSQGLKSVTKYKLGYDPVEVDPELMLEYAKTRPDHMASYSVSDAVATYYLYTTYVHNFIFSMSTIIPMGPEDVLRKGSGTLCESLLMVEAFKGNIICPNKQSDAVTSFYEGHLLDSETYIGGHVECLEAGVFRADIPTKFNLVPSALQQLIDNIDRDLNFALEIEHGMQRSDVVNYDEIRQAIVEKLEMLRDSPVRNEPPMIYHLDVGAMYPNIILTNRLQPSAMVSQSDCAACEFNRAENKCKRDLTWVWRGDHTPANFSEYQVVKRQLTYEKVDDVPFIDLTEREQAAMIKKRLKLYSNGVYKKTKVTTTEERVNTVCMRENSFYVNTVRAFRDRRYDYKLLTKTWKNKKSDAEKKGDLIARKVAEDKEVLMDSLQLAHKCILNSFYGYVMRKGARWRSMEMAGIVTHTGAQLIMQARELVEQIGRPLELDTDGIWAILPSSFPTDFKFKLSDGGKVSIGYPCVMLNADVHERYTNHQYQTLHGSTASKRYTTHSECSIFFELDGPYKAMILPASPEEGKLLKKKYAVYNFDGSMAELKGFELKRKGELEVVKLFQGQVFSQFLAGTSLKECYAAVGGIGNHWLDILHDKGMSVDDEELLALISEKKTISKTVDDYEGRRATSLTTAQRISDFLGSETVKDRGLSCNLIISCFPAGAPVTERALPVSIFSAEFSVMQFYLRKWLKEPKMDCNPEVWNFRDIVDWDYYIDRLGKTIQKIVTIPAGLQGIDNPCPRVDHPIWLQRTMNESVSSMKQTTLRAHFGLVQAAGNGRGKVFSGSTPRKVAAENDSSLLASISKRGRDIGDLEDLAGAPSRSGMGPIAHYKKTVSVHFDVGDFKDEGDVNVAVDETDMIVSSPSPKSRRSLLGSSSSISPAEKVLVQPVFPDKPNTEEELVNWLKERKTRWTQERLRKKQLRGNIDPRSIQQLDSEGRKKPMGVADFIRNASLSATFGVWQVIELQELDSPGEFVVWAMTDRAQLQRLNVIIPRIMYVNCKGSAAENAAIDMGGLKVKRDLPHDRPLKSLYEVQMPERKFLRNEKTLSLFLSDPQIEGVYEMKNPLWFRGILRLGCVSKVTKANKGNRSFKLQDIDFLNVNTHPYLEKSVGIFRRIFVYHVADRSRNSGLGIVALFIIDGTNEDPEEGVMVSRAYVWLTNGTGLLESRPPLQRIFRKFCPDERSQCKFTTTFTSDLSAALDLCNEKLGGYLRERRGPTIALLQGPMDARRWRKAVPQLQDFPVVTMPVNTTDELFPALNWQIFIAERMMQRYLHFPDWFEDRLECARYAHVPVANLGSDATMSMADVIFARQLVHNRHLLWASEGSLPDIGGAEMDQGWIWSDPLSEPVINSPGVYRSVCVEVEVYGLAVAAIMCSSLLDTFEIGAHQSASSGGGENDAPAQTHDTACINAFNILKAVVAKWIQDVRFSNDQHADVLLIALYRYLCGHGFVLLHDPAIHRLVYGLMTKLFKRLVFDLKKLGAKVVYASFNRIVIDTNKHDFYAAKEYTEFILSALSTKELYKCLQLHIKGFHEQLIWLDPDNWGGITMKDPALAETVDLEANLLDQGGAEYLGEDAGYGKDQGSDVDENDDIGDEDDEKIVAHPARKSEYDFLDEINNVAGADVQSDALIAAEEAEAAEMDAQSVLEAAAANRRKRGLESNWNLALFLPPAVGEYFHVIIGNFMLHYRDFWQHHNQIRNHSLNDTGMLLDEEPVFQSDDDIATEVQGQMKHLIKNTISDQLMHIVEEVHTHFSALPKGAPNPFPTRAGSHPGLTSPALELIKAVTHIMLLDSSISAEVLGLRRALLAQVKVRQFSSDSDFMDPCLSFILGDVFCTYCGLCRDLDLLRDLGITGPEETRWQCAQCRNVLDRVGIENRLIEEAERSTIGYVLQDLYCPQTRRAARRLCSARSEMSAPLVMNTTPDSFCTKIDVFVRIAQFYKFEFLEAILQDVIGTAIHADEE